MLTVARGYLFQFHGAFIDLCKKLINIRGNSKVLYLEALSSSLNLKIFGTVNIDIIELEKITGGFMNSPN